MGPAGRSANPCWLASPAERQDAAWRVAGAAEKRGIGSGTRSDRIHILGVMQDWPVCFEEQHRIMNSLAKNVLYGSMGVAGLVAAAAVLDFVTGGGIFAAHSMAGYVMDVLFIVVRGS